MIRDEKYAKNFGAGSTSICSSRNHCRVRIRDAGGFTIEFA
jgi:hypothetical protein